MAAPLREIVVGTDDCDGVARATLTLEEHTPQQPTLAEVGEHVESLWAIVVNNGAPIDAASLDLIDTIVDRLDQLYYWAVEESTTFLHQPSVLAQCGAPRLVFSCAMTRRPKIVIAALRVMSHLLRHEQPASELFALAAMRGEGCVKSVQPVDGDGFFDMLASVMETHAGLAELQAEAAAVAAEAARVDVERLLESSVVSCVLAALRRHGGSTAMQIAGVRLFAVLVDIQRGAPVSADTTGAAPPTPVAVLLTQFGVVTRFVVEAVAANVNNVEVKRNAVHFLLRCAAHKENLPVLLLHGAYPLLVNALVPATHVPELFVELMEAIAYFIPLLDPLQRRSLVLVTRQVLLGTTSSFFVLLCASLLVRLLRVAAQSDVALDRHLQTAWPEDKTPASIPRRGGGLLPSETIRLDDNDIREFMLSVSIPQLLCCAADTIGEEDAVLRRVVAEAIRLLSPYCWR